VPSSIGLELVVLALSVEVISSGLCRSVGWPITLAGCNEFFVCFGEQSSPMDFMHVNTE